MAEQTTVAERLAAVREQIDAAALRAGRTPSEVTLVAVSKTHPPDAVRAALAAGQLIFGENRIQEAEGKIAQLEAARAAGLQWHLIGHLQRNKARKAAQLFDLIHSVDSLRLAQALSRAVVEDDGARTLPILLQVNVSGEASKEGFDLPGGVASPGLAAFLTEVEQIAALPGLELRGLMTIAPFVDDQQVVRGTFRALRLLRDDLARRLPGDWRELSMGMSGDLDLAIEEGATLVRVGTAIFGSRSY